MATAPCMHKQNSYYFYNEVIYYRTGILWFNLLCLQRGGFALGCPSGPISDRGARGCKTASALGLARSCPVRQKYPTWQPARAAAPLQSASGFALRGRAMPPFIDSFILPPPSLCSAADCRLAARSPNPFGRLSDQWIPDALKNRHGQRNFLIGLSRVHVRQAWL